MFHDFFNKMLAPLGYAIIPKEKLDDFEKKLRQVTPPHEAEKARRGRLSFVIFSLPKSGGQVLREMLNRSRRSGPQQLKIPQCMSHPNGLHVQTPIHPDFLTQLPEGGWHHSHAEATNLSLDVMHADRIRYIVQVRHPLDQLVAYYCHELRHPQFAGPGQTGLRFGVPMARVENRYFTKGADVHAGLRHLICDGYLEAAMEWICNWCEFRDSLQSELVRYEDLVTDPMAVLKTLAEFLSPILKDDPDTLSDAVAALEDYRRHSLGLNPQSPWPPDQSAFYPLGWTGKIGIRDDYFSSANMELARQEVARFLRRAGKAKHLVACYPDLISRGAIDSACRAESLANVAFLTY